MLIVLGIIVLLVLWFISVQRNLVKKDELCSNAMSQIGVQQSSRWDALSSIVELIKSYNEHEYNTIKDVIAQRKTISSSSTAADAAIQEEAMGSALRQISIVAEQYPQIKANETYAKGMDSVNTYENQVRMSRMVFNDTVTAFNNIVRQFPSSIVANLLHFERKDYLAEPEGKTDMPSMKI